VFLAGMEEGILPHSNSLEQSEDIEEERRLCYVGMTRAREQLYCLHSLERRIHGKFREQSPSSFLGEIPSEVKDDQRLPGARMTRTNDSWRERPMGTYSSYGDNYSDRFDRPGQRPNYGSSGSGYGQRRSPAPPARPTAPAPRPVSAPKPAPTKAAKQTESINSVFSFFGDAAPAAPSPSAAPPPAAAPRPTEAPRATEGPRAIQFDPSAIRPVTQRPPEGAPVVEFKRGARVRHEQFGVGIILTMEGSGGDAKLTVYFDRVGSKKFVAKYAKLTRA
jgi:DNA helicase-2/ATP-dependent DNA helicase PcrA